MFAPFMPPPPKKFSAWHFYLIPFIVLSTIFQPYKLLKLPVWLHRLLWRCDRTPIRVKPFTHFTMPRIKAPIPKLGRCTGDRKNCPDNPADDWQDEFAESLVDVQPMTRCHAPFMLFFDKDLEESCKQDAD